MNAKPDLYAVMKVGRYNILDEVGQGAMGIVYRAHDPLIERTVAIKTVPIAELQQEGANAESRFLREAQSAGRLSHPNIVTIYDVGEADGLAYIAMEFLSGSTLRDIMNKGPMPFDLVIDTITQMAEALAFAHQHGVIHRDIKPANVIVTGQRGHIKLTDFGIAHLTNSGHTLVGQMLGSPRYMSPEQAMGFEVDGRSDIFSLGAVLYEMLTGQYAFDGDSLPTIVFRVVNETPEAAASIRPRLPDNLATLLARMLNKKPAARPDARELVQALHALSTSLPDTPSLPPSNRVAPLLAALAFAAPFVVVLIFGLGIIVIEHFIDIPKQTAIAPDLQRSESVPKAGSFPALKSTSVPTVLQKEEPVKKDAYLEGIDKKQIELKIKRTELLLKFTEKYPDVVQIDRQLEQLSIERRKHLKRVQNKQAR